MNTLRLLIWTVMCLSLLFAFPGYAAVRCHPDVGSGATRLATLNLTKEECQRLEKLGSPMIIINLNYMSGSVVPSSRGVNIISIRITEPGARYNPMAVFDKKTPTSEMGDIKIYGVGERAEYRFSGEDGTELFVSGLVSTWVARRTYRGFAVKYQYSRQHKDFKFMDGVVVRFLDRLLVQGDGDN